MADTRTEDDRNPKSRTRFAFCSFKGGTGRTLALANTAVRLAATGLRVGCIDYDIESCGLHKVLGVETVSRPVQEFFITAQMWRRVSPDREFPNFDIPEVFKGLVVDVDASSSVVDLAGNGQTEGKLWLIAARHRPKLTAAALGRASIMERTASLLSMFEDQYDLDCLLLDCRSGVSNLTLPGLRWSDYVLVFFRPGVQHFEGTRFMASWLAADRELRLANLEVGERIQPQAICLAATAVPEEALTDVDAFMEEVSASTGAMPLVVVDDAQELRSRERIYASRVGDDSEASPVSVAYDDLAAHIAALHREHG